MDEGGKKEERKEGRKERRRKGRKEERKDGIKEGRREGRKKGGKEGRRERRREGIKEGRKKGGKEERREGVVGRLEVVQRQLSTLGRVPRLLLRVVRLVVGMSLFEGLQLGALVHHPANGGELLQRDSVPVVGQI